MTLFEMSIFWSVEKWKQFDLFEGIFCVWFDSLTKPIYGMMDIMDIINIYEIIRSTTRKINRSLSKLQQFVAIKLIFAYSFVMNTTDNLFVYKLNLFWHPSKHWCMRIVHLDVNFCFQQSCWLTLRGINRFSIDLWRGYCQKRVWVVELTNFNWLKIKTNIKSKRTNFCMCSAWKLQHPIKEQLLIQVGLI